MYSIATVAPVALVAGVSLPGAFILRAVVADTRQSLAYVVWKIVYNLFFHPLAKFPGPRLNAISDVPGIYILVKGRFALEVKKLHDKYGSVVRVSPNELSFNSVQAWEDIYGMLLNSNRREYTDLLQVIAQVMPISTKIQSMLDLSKPFPESPL